MPRRAASITQADIARAIRAMRDAGFPSVRVVVRDGQAVIEPASARREADDPVPEDDIAPGEPLVLL